MLAEIDLGDIGEMPGPLPLRWVADVTAAQPVQRRLAGRDRPLNPRSFVRRAQRHPTALLNARADVRLVRNELTGRRAHMASSTPGCTGGRLGRGAEDLPADLAGGPTGADRRR